MTDLNDAEAGTTAPNEEGVFSAPEDGDANKNPGSIELIIRALATLLKAFLKFFGNVGPFIEDIINFFSNDFLKYFPKMFKSIAELFKVLGKNGPMGKFFKGLLDLNFDMIDNILGLCNSVRAINKGLCKIANGVCIGFKKVNKAFSGFLVGNDDINCETCDVNKLSGACAKKPKVAHATDVVEAGRCDELECEIDFVDFFAVLESQNRGCDFWLSNSSANLYCITSLQQFVVVNGTDAGAASTDTLAGEACFVLHAHHVDQCLALQPPFGFDHEQAAKDICDNDRYGASFEQCTCELENPLCDESCCTIYAEHINAQVLAQIGDRTCAEVSAYFTEAEVFCPFYLLSAADVPFLSDYTYMHAICNYGRKAIIALCADTVPFTRVRDLDIASVLPSIVVDTCTRVVNATSVCQPASATFESTLIDVFNAQGKYDIEAIFTSNDAETLDVTVPIITDTTTAPTVADLFTRLNNKQYCQQYSIRNGNRNALFRGQSWNVRAAQSAYCDQNIAKVEGSIDIDALLSHVYTTDDGSFKSSGLEGLPVGTETFSSAVPGAESAECEFGTGMSPEEVNLVQNCAYELQVRMTDTATATSEFGGETFDELDQVDAVSASFQFLGGGTSELDPNSTGYANHVREVDEIDAAANVNTDGFEAVPFDQAKDTVGFREIYVEQPAADSFDRRNIYGNLFPTKTGGRAILSLVQSNPRHAITERVLTAVHRETLHLREFSVVAAFMGLREGENALKTHRRERKFWIRAVKAVDSLVDEYNRLQSEEEGSDGPYSGARVLLQTTDKSFNARINEVLSRLEDMPASPPLVGELRFSYFIEEQIQARMQYVSFHAQTNIFPVLFNRIFGPSAPLNGTFEGTAKDGNNETECRAIMADPYRCCTAESTPYECCFGLPTCIPELPKWIFLDRTTVETIDKWQCREVDSLFEWWYWTIHVVIAGFTRLFIFGLGRYDGLARTLLDWLTLTADEVPRNLGPCLLVNIPFFFLGVLILYAIFVLFGVQMITQFVLLINRYKDNMRSLDREAENNSRAGGDAAGRME